MSHFQLSRLSDLIYLVKNPFPMFFPIYPIFPFIRFPINRSHLCLVYADCNRLQRRFQADFNYNFTDLDAPLALVGNCTIRKNPISTSETFSEAPKSKIFVISDRITCVARSILTFFKK